MLCRRPWVCGISSLGIDHTQILGDTIEKIAWQKGGIFKVGLTLCLKEACGVRVNESVVRKVDMRESCS